MAVDWLSILPPPYLSAYNNQVNKIIKIAGFDPGRSYTAWAVLRGTARDGFELYRHGLLFPPDIGATKTFGRSLPYWGSFFQVFIEFDLKPHIIGIERFVYRPGGQGQGAEDINLRIPAMIDPRTYLVRNTDWKRYFTKYVCSEGTLPYFGTPTPHEADAAGIAMYLAGMLINEQNAKSQSD